MGGDNVEVCVRIRPQSEVELEQRCSIVTRPTPGEPQLVMGRDKTFTYDYLFDMDSQQHQIFDACVRDLVDGAIKGKNATVLAYGQTGSGKTFTMGTGFDIDLDPALEGVVPRAVKYLFKQIEDSKADAQLKGLPLPEFEVTVSFLELYRTSFFDLFDSTPGRNAANVKILDERKEDGSVVTSVSNVIKLAVHSVEELMGLLRRGSLGRVTASTDMNARSSRSHAVFTLWVKHRRVATYSKSVVPGAEGGEAEGTASNSLDPGGPNDSGSEPVTPVTPNPASADIVMTTAKFNFVDLAGSERLKRTNATGDRAKEGIDINSGLLALGNVISALGDPGKRGAYVPYRDSKLTRLLQDSLGGNSQTLMIACVAPNDRDFLETLNTLKYANRARNIKNKVVVNQDSASAQIQKMHETIQKLQLELMQYKQGRRPGGGDDEGANDMFEEMQMLRRECDFLKKKVEGLKVENYNLQEQVVACQMGAAPGAANPAASATENGAPPPTNGSAPNPDAPPARTFEDVLRENVRLKADLAAAKVMPAMERRPSTAATIRPETARPATSAVVSESMQAIRKGRSVIQKLGSLFSSPRSKSSSKDLTNQSSEPEIKSFDTDGKAEGDDDDSELEDGDDTTEDEGDSDSLDGEGAELPEAVTEDDEDAPVVQVPDAEEEDEDTGSAAPRKESASGQQSALEEEAGEGGIYDDQEDADDEDAVVDSQGNVAYEKMSETHQQLVEELGLQISIQEKLLAELHIKENELVRQRQLYEAKLSEAQKEKDELKKQQREIERRLGGLKGKSDDETKKIKKDYQGQLKSLKDKMTAIAEEKSRKERELEERQKALSQMETLKTNLREAKQQRRKLLEEAKVELKAQRELERQRAKEIAKLKKEGNKAQFVNRKMESQLKNKQDALERTMGENRKLKDQLKQAKKEREDAIKLSNKYRRTQSSSSRPLSAATSSTGRLQGGGGGGSSSGGSSSFQTPQRKGKRRRSSGVGVKKTKSMLEGEIQRAVLYSTIKQDMEALVAKRDIELIKERLKFEAELKNNHPDAEKFKELKEELERVDAETELVTGTILDKQEELLAMEASGMRASVERDGLSESGQELIENTGATEARLMLREFFVSLVKKDAAISKERLRCKELEAELKRKDALLKSFVTSGVSKTDSMREAPQPQRSSSRSFLKGVKSRFKKTSSSEAISGSSKPSKQRLKKSHPPLQATAASTARTAASKNSYQDPRNFEVSLRRGRSERGIKGKNRDSMQVKDEIVQERRSTNPSSFLQLTHSIKGHEDEVLAVACHENSLVTGSKDSTVRIWDMGAQTFKARLTGHNFHVKSLLHLGDIILSASRERLRVWDPREKARCVKKINMKSEIQGLSASQDGTQIYVGSKHVIRVWDIRNYKQLRAISTRSKLQCISSTTHGIATGSIDNAIRMYDLTDPHKSNPSAQLMTPPHYDNVTCLTTVGSSVLSGSRDYSIKRWAPVADSPGVWHLAKSINAAHGHYVSAVGALPASGFFASGDTKGIIKVWDMDKSLAVSELGDHDSSVNDFAFSGSTVFSASSDRTVKVWRWCDPAALGKVEQPSGGGSEAEGEMEDPDATPVPVEAIQRESSFSAEDTSAVVTTTSPVPATVGSVGSGSTGISLGGASWREEMV